MTLRTLIACASPLSGLHTVRDHLSAINCNDLGSGEGIVLLPVDSISVEAPAHTHTIDIGDRNIEINISTQKYSADISSEVFVAINNTSKEVNSGCTK